MKEKSKYKLRSDKKPLKFVGIAIILYVLLACNSFGQSITWERTYLFSPFVRGYSIKQTTDGNYIVCGNRTFHGGFVIKLSPYGDTLWLKEDFPVNEFHSILQAKDGNYIVLGHRVDFSTDFMYIAKLDINGNIIWTRLYSETNFLLKPYYIDNTNDNSFIICGNAETENPTTSNAYYSKIDNDGNLIWSRIIIAQGEGKTLHHVKQLINSEYILTGGKNGQVYLIKTNSNGDTIWTKSYGTSSYAESGVTVFNTFDNGFLIIGRIFYGGAEYKLYFTKTDSNGNFSWSKLYGDTNLSYQLMYGNCAVKDNFQNRYLITGRNVNLPTVDTFQVFLLAIDSLGNALWDKKFNNDTLNFGGWGIDNCSDSGFIITGDAFRNFEKEILDPPGYLYALKTNRFGEIGPIGIFTNTQHFPESFSVFQNYPNPFNSSTIIEFEVDIKSIIEINIYDILGKEVKKLLYDEHFNPGKYIFNFFGNELTSGVYFVQISNEKKERKTIKTLLIK